MWCFFAHKRAYRVKKTKIFIHPVNSLGMVGIQIKENGFLKGVLPDRSGSYEYEKLCCFTIIIMSDKYV